MSAQRVDDIQADINPGGIIQPAFVRYSLVERVACLFKPTVYLFLEQPEPGKLELAVDFGIQQIDLSAGELFTKEQFVLQALIFSE